MMNRYTALIWLNDGRFTAMLLAYTIDVFGDDEESALNEIFRRFNTEHPPDYHNRSLSAGDIVVLNGRAFLCLTQGWFAMDSAKVGASC